MKKFTFLATAFLIGCCAVDVSAQFPLKIPKILKPKTEQAKPAEQPTTPAEQTTPNGSGQASPTTAKPQTGGGVGHMPRPRPTSVPVLLKDTLEIHLRRYQVDRSPTDRGFSTWLPHINFDVYHDQSETVRYTVEWLKPDGSLWFRVPMNGTLTHVQDIPETVAQSSAVGVHGFRLLNTKTKEIVFQGKFNVKKIDLSFGDPRSKNSATFYVDQDWSLPYGYVGFEWNTSWDYDPTPIVYLWFKGELRREDFEARLFHGGKQIASTDDGGIISDGNEERNHSSCMEKWELCKYRLWEFSWNLRVESFDKVANPYSSHVRRPEHIYTKDTPGEYTVKVFHKGAQVRETKFTVEPNGWLAANPFAAQMPLQNRLVLIPVKVSGTLDKWNAAAWKTEAFYGNPVTGFNVP